MYYCDKDKNRTAKWVNNVRNLIANDLADEVDSILKANVDSYEYEKISYPEGKAPLKERIQKNILSQYYFPGSATVMAMLTTETMNFITYETLSDRAKKELDLFDRIYDIEKMALGPQEDAKRIEKVLFDDDGSYFREIFKRIAGGQE